MTAAPKGITDAARDGWFAALPEWVVDLLPWLGVFSVVCFVATPILVAVLVARMPADYFDPDRRRKASGHPALRILCGVLRNAVGAVLVLAGVAMLVLPGQGILTILIGIVAMDFPGKYDLERRVARRPWVAKALNGIRRRAGSPPLSFGGPGDDDPGAGGSAGSDTRIREP